MRSSILVTGGAGYIGSIVTDFLVRQGESVVVLDNLSLGHREAVHPDSVFYQGNVGDSSLVQEIIARHQVEACLHFAAFASVGESVLHPQKYYQNNTANTLALLQTLIKKGVRHFVFSSTCATYGNPQYLPLNEKHPQWPINPYGWSKLMVERMLADFSTADQINFIALRYFNACGATENLGESHDPETHLIPLILQTAQGDRPDIKVFGDDYDTPDGTAIRDYIHVSDLATAHYAALKSLRKGNKSTFLNIGAGVGYSVQQVIDTARYITQKKIISHVTDRRLGDPGRLVADISEAKSFLDWEPQITEIHQILESAWHWMQTHPSGYKQRH